MSSIPLPTFPGADVAVERESIYNNSIYTTVSGKEQRVAWAQSPRYQYTVKYNVLRENKSAPAPYGLYSEVNALLKHWDDHMGTLDSFPFTDPYTGDEVQVRFLEGSLVITKIAEDLWEAEVALISVK